MVREQIEASIKLPQGGEMNDSNEPPGGRTGEPARNPDPNENGPTPGEGLSRETTFNADQRGQYNSGGLAAPIKLPLSSLIVDLAIQQRVGINAELVAEYAANIGDWIAQAPIDVFADEGARIVADGFHRVHACLAAGLEHIFARLHQGTRRDALLFAIGANRAHGLRRSNDDKRKAVETMLLDPEWRRWSDRKIAEQAGVSHTFVANQREVATVATPRHFVCDTEPDQAPVAELEQESAATETQRPAADPAPKPAPARQGKDGKMYPSKPPAPAAPQKPKAPTAKDAMHAAHAVTAALVALESVADALLPQDRPPLIAELEKALARYRPLVADQGADHA